MVAATVGVSVNAQEMRNALESDGELFIETMLPEQLESPVPTAHKEIWQLLTSTAMSRVLLAIPRGHAKTTLAKLCVAWYFLYTDFRFCVYVSNTNGIALNACSDIMGYIQSDNFASIYGPVKILKANVTHSLWVFELTMANGKRKKCILRALGANQQVRGINVDNERPDIAVVDDLEDEDTSKNETTQKALDLWVFGPFIKALAKDHKIIWLGNMITETCLLARLSQDSEWNPVVFGSLIKDKESGQIVPLWPWLWSVQKLMKDFAAYKKLGLKATWLCEMMNMPGHMLNGFGPESLHYMPVPTTDSILAAFITIDPAFGEKKENDETAIAVHVIPEGGIPMVADVSHGQWSESEMFEEALRLAFKWNAWVWGIESVAAQRVLISLFRLMLAPLHLARQVHFIPLISGNAKVGRIRAWASMMGSEPPTYGILEDDIDIGSQLMSYDVTTNHNKDDIIDACAYGPMMIDAHLNILLSHYAEAAGIEPYATDEEDLVDV